MARTVMGKTRPAATPYATYQNHSGWTWRVLKSYQADNAKPYARWLCDVSSPHTFGGSDMGDTYVAYVVKHGVLISWDESVEGLKEELESARNAQAVSF